MERASSFYWTIGWVGHVEPAEMRKILIPVSIQTLPVKVMTKPIYFVSHSGSLIVAIQMFYMHLPGVHTFVIWPNAGLVR
jgi:hypothetical protein